MCVCVHVCARVSVKTHGGNGSKYLRSITKHHVCLFCIFIHGYTFIHFTFNQIHMASLFIIVNHDMFLVLSVKQFDVLYRFPDDVRQ